MRRVPITSYCYVGLCAVLLLSVPVSWAEGMRSKVAAISSPLWRQLTKIQVLGAATRPSEAPSFHKPQNYREELERIQLENQQLVEEISRLRSALALEYELASDVADGRAEGIASNFDLEALERRRRENQQILRERLVSVPARVIYRSPVAWNSYVWVDVGSDTNKGQGQDVIALDSPVVVGNSLVGIVDLVNARQCRVRLITDPSLTPSVRATRGGTKQQSLLHHLDLLAEGLANDESVFESGQVRHRVLGALLDGRDVLLQQRESVHMAKGELRGSRLPLWRREGATLHGVGFNYDFADDEGPARDLRTGKVLGSRDTEAISLLQPGDVLVTTGLDGVLPPGLRVAQVSVVHPLREGDYFYELEARPTAGDLNDLSLVSVLPPTSDLKHP